MAKQDNGKNEDPSKGNPKTFAKSLAKALRGEADGVTDTENAGAFPAYCPTCGVSYDPSNANEASQHSGH
jgi:hypothetical protein